MIGEELTAYVLNVRDDGKVDVGLRPPGAAKISIGRDMILDKLYASASAYKGTSRLGLGCEGWLALLQRDAPVSDLGNRSDESPTSPATLGRQRAPSGLGQMVDSSDLNLGRIPTQLDGPARVSTPTCPPTYRVGVEIKGFRKCREDLRGACSSCQRSGRFELINVVVLYLVQHEACIVRNLVQVTPMGIHGGVHKPR